MNMKNGIDYIGGRVRHNLLVQTISRHLNCSCDNRDGNPLYCVSVYVKVILAFGNQNTQLDEAISCILKS